MTNKKNIASRLRVRLAGWQNRRRLATLTRQIQQHAVPDTAKPKVAFFNASTRLNGLSHNAAFSLLTGWSLRLAGVPVVHFTCQAGMSRCVLGINRSDYHAPPPCGTCTGQSQRLYTGADTHWFQYAPDGKLDKAVKELNFQELSQFEVPAAFLPNQPMLPLGSLVLPSLRWTLRRHHLPDDEPTRFLFREYIRSAYRVGSEFNRFLEQAQPKALVLFNGMMFPEATARWVAHQHGLPVITHEVSFQPFSAFFTDGDATAYPIHIPESFELDEEQNAELDAYLEKRFQGQFTMAGIRFWPEMRGLDADFLERAKKFRQIVPVFTNVIFDTSQVHANTVFPHMFAWLDQILEIIRAHPDTLFVIRAHPDEMRPGTAKKSRESVQDWVSRNGVTSLPNVIFIDSQEFVSSYELIQRSKFVMVYNSSIGLESTLMGTAVLCGGKARYTQYPIVFFPDSPQDHRQLAEAFLNQPTQDGDRIRIPTEFQQNARRFLYYQLYRASLPFEAFLEVGPRPGFVKLRSFSWRDLLPQNSPTMQVLLNGILTHAQAGPAELDADTFFTGESHARRTQGSD